MDYSEEVSFTLGRSVCARVRAGFTGSTPPSHPLASIIERSPPIDYLQPSQASNKCCQATANLCDWYPGELTLLQQEGRDDFGLGKKYKYLSKLRKPCQVFASDQKKNITHFALGSAVTFRPSIGL